MAQGQFTYTLTVDSRQYKRELAQASKVATKLAGDLSKSLKSQQASLSDLGRKLQTTQRQFQNLSGAVKAFPGVAKGNERDQVYLTQLAQKVREATAAFFEGEKGVRKYQTALGRLAKIDASQIRRAQVIADPAKARDDLSAQNRRNRERLLTLNKISEQLRVATSEQKRLNQAGLDTSKVDLQVARLVSTHVRLNGALDRGVASAARLEAELKDVARQQKILGSTQYQSPIGPAAPRRGFGGNTGRRAAIGSRLGAAGGLGKAAAAGAVAGAVGGVALAAAQAILTFVDNAKKFVLEAPRVTAEFNKMKTALRGVVGSDAPEAMNIIQKQVTDFNVPLTDATANFTKLAASTRSAGLSTKDTEQVFRGMIAANKALGGSNEQLNGILLATQQVFSKGKVTAEELRGQIGERLPGAVSLFATSMGITTAELDKRLEEGTVSVEEFVNFAGSLVEEFEEKALGIARGPEEAGARLQTALTNLQINIGILLLPIGEAFQNTFAGIVNIINQATISLQNFLGIGAEGALNKAKDTVAMRRDAVLRFDAATDGEFSNVQVGDKVDTPFGQMEHRRSELLRDLQAAEAALEAETKRYNASVKGVDQPGMEKGTLVTSEDLINNRKGKGKGVDPAKEAARLSNIAAENARRLRNEQSKQALALLKQRYDIEKRLEQEKQRLVLDGLFGAERAQQETFNAYKTQNLAITEEAKRLEDAVAAAEDRVAAAQERLDAATSAPDRARAQGRLDVAQAQQVGAQSRFDQFSSNAVAMRSNTFEQMINNSTAAFRERAASLRDETENLQLRNRLMMEGFSPEMIEQQLQIAQFDRDRAAQIGILNQLREQGNLNELQYAEALNAVNEAAEGAKESVEALTQAQIEAADPIRNYIESAQEYIGNTRERLGEMLSTVDNALASSIEGVVTGTMTIQEAFHSFFKNIGQAFLKMASQMIAKLIIISLLKKALGMFGGGGVGVAPDAGDAMDGGGFLPMISPGETPFANGGIVTQPTRALIGEGGMNEAVVPLPNGKAIPVDLKGVGGGGAVTSNVTVNVSNEGGGDNEMSGDNAGKLGKAIDGAIRKVIMDERRSGGLLYMG